MIKVKGIDDIYAVWRSNKKPNGTLYRRQTPFV